MNNSIIYKALSIWTSENASRKNYGFSVNGHVTEENYLIEVVWNDGIDEKGFSIPMEAPISWSDLQAFITKANDYFTSQEYVSLRTRAYNKNLGGWREQLDMIYHDIDDWKTKVKAIKDANPKT